METKEEIIKKRIKRIKTITHILKELEELRQSYNDIYGHDDLTGAIVSLESQLSKELTKAYKLGILKFMEE